jgi:hypothetical protein
MIYRSPSSPTAAAGKLPKGLPMYLSVSVCEPRALLSATAIARVHSQTIRANFACMTFVDKRGCHFFGDGCGKQGRPCKNDED